MMLYLITTEQQFKLQKLIQSLELSFFPPMEV